MDDELVKGEYFTIDFTYFGINDKYSETSIVYYLFSSTLFMGTKCFDVKNFRVRYHSSTEVGKTFESNVVSFLGTAFNIFDNKYIFIDFHKYIFLIDFRRSLARIRAITDRWQDLRYDRPSAYRRTGLLRLPYADPIDNWFYIV